MWPVIRETKSKEDKRKTNTGKNQLKEHIILKPIKISANNRKDYISQLGPQTKTNIINVGLKRNR